MAFFDKQSNYNKNANFSSVVIGADAPVLEAELNEMQEIQRERLRTTVKVLFLDGVKGTGDYTYNPQTSNLHIQNELVIIQGEVLEITEGNVRAKEGDTIYVEVWEDVVTCNDRIPKYGNTSGNEYIENYLIDSRIGIETSRRKQVRFLLSTKIPKQNPFITLGKIQNDTFTLLANSVSSHIRSEVTNDIIKPISYLTLQAGNKKFNLYVSPKGELITQEVGLNIPLSPQVILRDPEGARWLITVTEEGEVCTSLVSKGIVTPTLYLQAIEPYAVIFKIGVSSLGEIYSAPICDLDLVKDQNIGTDITWSSSKIAQTFEMYNKEILKLKKEINTLKKMLGGVNNNYE